MSKPGGFVFYVRDWLTSLSVARMTDQQVRIYLNLLCYSWLDEPTATLPNDDAELARLAHVSLAEWQQIKDPILAKFETNGNGRIHNAKLKAEADKCAQRSFAGKSGWTTKRRQRGAKAARTLRSKT